MALICLLYAAFASVFTIGKAALEIASPLFLIGGRMIVAGILMSSYAIWRFPDSSLKTARSHWWVLCMLALVGVYLTNVLEFWALQRLPSATTCFFYSLSPFIAAIIAFFTLDERLSFQQLIGLGIAFLSALPQLKPEFGGEIMGGSFQAQAAILGAVICSVYGWILLKKATVHLNINSFLANGISMFLGGMMAISHSLAVESWDPLPTRDLSSFLLFSLALLLISNIFCYNLYAYLLNHFSATFLSFAGFITAIFTALFGFVFLGEIPTTDFYLSTFLSILGLYLFYREELTRTAWTIRATGEA